MNATHKNNLLGVMLLTATFAFTGCATISATLIAPDIQTPTLTREDTLDLGFGVVPGRGATLFDDASDRPPTYTTDFASIDNRGGGLTAGMAYGIAKSIAIGGGLIGSDNLIDGLWAAGKMQLVGTQGILPSPLLITLHGRLGGTHGSSSGDHNGEFGPGGFPWEATRSGNFINGGVSVGYSITPSFTPFIGYGVGRASIKAEVKQTAAGGDPGGVFSQSFKGKMTTWGGGVQFFEEKVRICIGAQRTKTEVGSYSVQESMALLSLNFRISDRRPTEVQSVGQSQN